MLSNFTLSSHSNGFTAPIEKQRFILGSWGVPGGLVSFHWSVGPGCKGIEFQLWKARAMIIAKWLIKKLSLMMVLMGRTEKQSRLLCSQHQQLIQGRKQAVENVSVANPVLLVRSWMCLLHPLPLSSFSTEYVSPWDVAAGQGTI